MIDERIDQIVRNFPENGMKVLLASLYKLSPSLELC
jgi:hypothetical protein